MKPADLFGLYGLAWKVAPPSEADFARHPGWRAGIAAWLLVLPHAHLAWHSYWLSACHLRPVHGTPDPIKESPRMDHEVVLHALDPSKPWPDPDHVTGFAKLTPPNLVMQFHGLTDEQVNELLLLMVRGFVDGRLNPDTDDRRRTESVLATTVEHLRSGHHHGDRRWPDGSRVADLPVHHTHTYDDADRCACGLVRGNQ